MALTRFTLRQLEAFAAVADLHGFAAAGKRLGMTAQAVSQLVADLESAIGLRLFDRTTRRVALSAAGREFIEQATPLLRQVRQAESSAQDLRARGTGLLRVGAPQVLAGWALPAILHDYARQHPRVSVRIRDVAVDRLVEGLLEGQVDLAVGPDRPVDARVRWSPLFECPWVLWCAPAHALARKRSLRWSDLRGHALIAAGRDHEGSVAQMHASIPEPQRISPIDVVDHISTALGLSAQGLAATLAPAYVGVLARSMGLVMRRVTEPEVMRRVGLYQNLERALTPAGEALARHLQQGLAQWYDAGSH